MLASLFSRSPKQSTFHANTLTGTYLILKLFFTASKNRKISTALNGTCTKDLTKLTPEGSPLSAPNRHDKLA